MREFTLRFDGASGPRAFSSPRELLRADTPEQAWEALDRAQDALRDGYAIAGFLSYEFGYACVDLPVPRRMDETLPLPLLALGIFSPDGPQDALCGASSGRRTQGDPAREWDECKITSPFSARLTPAQYSEGIAKIHELLREGELYQVNYTTPFDFSFAGSARHLYDSLGARSSAPHRALLTTSEYSLVSISPELFLEFQPGRLTTKPMKGTSRSGCEHELRSEKNRAEHLMIVDLLRNDLGRVSRLVKVNSLFAVERYPTFSTMTSTISGETAPGTELADIFRALFPCGSITGAPKRAAVREIAHIEHSPRGAYCGSLGYLCPDGTGSWNVAIRTLQLCHRTGRGRLDLGGGIVADSVATTEWEEILVKGQVFSTLAPFVT